jgi:hypothetical protein
MRDRKLYDLLRRLSTEERALFAEYLRSPLHAHRPKLADMVLLMETLLFATPDRECSSEEFYAAFYPGKPFDGNNLNRLISVITTEFKEFLALRFFQRDRTARTACATREMSRRRWDDILPKEIALTRKALQEELPDDEHNYYQLYCLEYENARHYVESPAKKSSLIFTALSDAVDRLFAQLKNKIFCYAAMYDRRYELQHKFRWITILDSEAGQLLIQNSNTTRLFENARTLIQNPLDKGKYESYLEILDAELPHYNESHDPTSTGKVNKIDAESLLGIALNTASYISKFEPGFQHLQQLRIVDKGISKGILLEEGFLNRKSFENYIKTAAVIGKLDRAWDFCNSASSLLHPKDFKIAPLLSGGLLHIFEKRPNEASRLLLKLKSTLSSNSDSIDSLEVRTMLCLVWYQLGEFDSLAHEINAMRAYLSRLNLISKSSIATYIRFLNAMSQVEAAERKAPEKKFLKYATIIWNLENKQKFTCSGLLKRDILDKYQGKINSWHQEGNPGAN